MADFARWAVAAEPDMGITEGGFLSAYDENQSAANALSLEQWPLAAVIETFARNRRNSIGTPTQLHEELTKARPLNWQGSWPPNAAELSKILKRIQHDLQRIGVEVRISALEKPEPDDKHRGHDVPSRRAGIQATTNGRPKPGRAKR